MRKKPKILRLPKTVRSRRKDIEVISTSTEEHIDKHFFRRLANLAKVRRFVIGWLILLALIILVGFLQFGALRDKYQKLQFVPGGNFNEGLIGAYTNVNPIYASSSVDSSVSKLIFAGLFTYDSKQNLVPDLANKIDIDPGEKIYTVSLKQNLVWHDGQPLTAEDVVFTFKTIQNPDARSPLLSGWQGINIESDGDYTVIFTLPNTLSSFPNSLTTGIIPAHLLKNVQPEQLRSSDFNTVKPVGSGPFKYDTVEVQEEEIDVRREQVGLLANDRYHRGEPGIKRYVISTYKDQDELLKAYDDKKVDAISGLGEINKSYAKDPHNNVYTVPLSGQTMVFFKTSQGVLADPQVRRALALGSDRQKIINSTEQVLQPSDGPLLKNQIGYDKAYIQNTGDIETAKKTLEDSGWKINPQTNIREKEGLPLQIRLFALSNPENKLVTEELKSQWKQIGAELLLNLENEQSLQDIVSTHSYDALLSTISIGVDPDVFAFWHSSQFDARSKSRLNFSEYNSPKADAALDAGRSRSDATVRAVKYKPFLEAWSQDNPALALYQPNYTFIVHSPFEGFDNKRLTSPIDRYSDVEKWMIRQDRR